MAFQLVDIQLAEPRSCVDLSQPVHTGVDQILIWCKETKISPLCDLYRYPHGTDVPILWSARVFMGIPKSWPAQMSPYWDVTAVQSSSSSGLNKSCTSAWFGTESSCWCEIQIPSSKQLTLACGWKRDKWISREQYPLTFTSFSKLAFPDVIVVTRKKKIIFFLGEGQRTLIKENTVIKKVFYNQVANYAKMEISV